MCVPNKTMMFGSFTSNQYNKKNQFLKSLISQLRKIKTGKGEHLLSRLKESCATCNSPDSYYSLLVSPPNLYSLSHHDDPFHTHLSKSFLSNAIGQETPFLNTALDLFTVSPPLYQFHFFNLVLIQVNVRM